MSGPASPSTTGAQQVEEIARRGVRCVTRCDGAATVWRRWGDPSASPLVLLHGGHGSWSHWIRNVVPLSAHHAVWVPDMPGYGDSDLPGAPVTAAMIARALSEGLARLPGLAGPVDLVGFSFGSVVAGHWAQAAAHQVRTLVLVGAAGLGFPRLQRPPMMSWRRIPGARERHALHRHNLGSLMLHQPARIDDLAVHLQTVNSAAARVRSRELSLSDSLRRLLAQIRVPVHGIWGAEDVTARPDLAARGELLRSSHPQAQFHCIAGAGHWVQYEDPVAFHRALGRCLGLPDTWPGEHPSRET